MNNSLVAKWTIRSGLYAAFRFREFLRSFTEKIPRHLPEYELPPNYLTLAPTNICNANCIFCTYQYRTLAGMIMSLDTARKCLDQFAAIGGGFLSFTPSNGEALIDKGLEEKVAYAKSLGNIRYIDLFTNGILLSKRRFEQMVDAGIDGLTISMSGFDENEYMRIFRKKFYRKVLGNLFDIAASPLFGDCRIDISLRTDSLFPSSNPVYKKLLRSGHKISRQIFYDNWAGKIRQSDLNGFMFIRPRISRRVPCRILYSGPIVQQDGKIIACGCRDPEGTSELYLGNIRNTTIEKSWLDGRVERFRQRFFNGDPPDICRDCRHYLPAPLKKIFKGRT